MTGLPPAGRWFNNVQASFEPMVGINLRFENILPDGKRQDLGICLIGAPRGPEVCPPHQALQYGEAQLLLDALLAAGVKPTAKITEEKSETFSAGKVEAMTAHIEDLRRIAFGDRVAETPRSPDTPLTRASEI